MMKNNGLGDLIFIEWILPFYFYNLIFKLKIVFSIE